MSNIEIVLKEEVVRLSRRESPRAELLAKVAALRGIGKRDARSRLEQLVAATKRARPKS